MCNNYHSNGRSIRSLASRLSVVPPPFIEVEADLHQWPSQPAPVVRQPHDSPLAWDLIPWGWTVHWQPQLILFARGETVHQKPTFAAAFQESRCLIPATSFEETLWFGSSTGEPLAIAGIIEGWRDAADGSLKHGFVMLSSPAAHAVQPYNDRQPLLLPESAWSTWINHGADLNDVRALIRTYPDLIAIDSPVPPPAPRRTRAQRLLDPDENQPELPW